MAKYANNRDADFLAILEKTGAFKDMEKVTKKVLHDQWQDLMYSGIVNTLFSKYKDYFTKPKGRRVTARKSFNKQEEDELRTSEDLKAAERNTLQADRILVGPNALNMAPLLLFMGKQIDSKMKSVGAYYRYKPEIKVYLKQMFNKAGQDIIDQIKTPKAIKFRLSKKEYIDKISERVDVLIKGLDTTTKKRMVNALAEGIKAGETKTEMIKRLQALGDQFSKNRAKRIVQTETEAVAEFSRHETARLNGADMKTWETVGDDRVCPICAPLDGKQIKVNESFEAGLFEGLYPPAHPVCRCTVSYQMDTHAFAQYIIQYKTASEKIEELFVKVKKEKDLYSPDKEIKALPITNPNAVWAGGESLVGPDKEVGNIYSEIIQYPNYRAQVRPLYDIRDKELVIDKAEFTPRNRTQELLVNARNDLSNEGFVQLMLMFGIKKKIPPKP